MKTPIDWSRFALAAAAELVIGQVAPLSGVLASTGKQMVVGGKIYFEFINAQGGCMAPRFAMTLRTTVTRWLTPSG